MEILSGFPEQEMWEKPAIRIADSAAAYLRELMWRPNPNLAEFAYLGLGNGQEIDTILAIEEDLSLRELNADPPKLQGKEIRPLFEKLMQSGRQNEFMMFGHSHPIGIKLVNGKYYFVAPGKKLLDPSMGKRTDGGPATGWDIGFFKWLYESVVEVPYVGISTNFNGKTQLRVYETEKLIQIKRARDLRKIPRKNFSF
jgi:hypothetical protein